MISSAGFFRENSLVMACFAFGNLEMRTENQIDLKINLVTHWNYLAKTSTINKGLFKKKLSLSIIVVLVKIP